jgi:hypothetical protein
MKWNKFSDIRPEQRETVLFFHSKTGIFLGRYDYYFNGTVRQECFGVFNDADALIFSSDDNKVSLYWSHITNIPLPKEDS